eukprot:1180304-Lingulodinium_polyedra.AAC.1
MGAPPDTERTARSHVSSPQAAPRRLQNQDPRGAQATRELRPSSSQPAPKQFTSSIQHASTTE